MSAPRTRRRRRSTRACRTPRRPPIGSTTTRLSWLEAGTARSTADTVNSKGRRSELTSLQRGRLASPT
eukprot:14047604-Alexandrium_andersonii.AAC.1